MLCLQISVLPVAGPILHADGMHLFSLLGFECMSCFLDWREISCRDVSNLMPIYTIFICLFRSHIRSNLIGRLSDLLAHK
jgi:hypothetical protein